MRCEKGFCLLLASLALFLSGSATAGDEVNYSAPYVTIENGELVTKYPAKNHGPDVESDLVEAGKSGDPAEDEAHPWLLLGLFSVVALAATAAVLRGRSS